MEEASKKLVSHSKEQMVAICADLVQHSSAIDKLISEEGPVDNLVIQGHIEVHLEKIKESLYDICHKYEIPAGRFRVQSRTNENKMDTKTQRQGMKLLLLGIERLQSKVRAMLSKTSNNAHQSQATPLSDLSIKLGNDLSRTSYLLQ